MFEGCLVGLNKSCAGLQRLVNLVRAVVGDARHPELDRICRSMIEPVPIEDAALVNWETLVR